MLSDPVLGLVVGRMQLLANPLRMRLLLALQDGESYVQELADVLGVDQWTASRGLSELHREGILARRRDGTRVLYSIADYTACRLIGQVAESVIAHIEELHDLVLESD
jgi:ArsR family transcriptional regulator